MSQPIIVRPCTVAELFGNAAMSTLISEYANECALAGMPAPDPQADTYAKIEAAGLGFSLGAFDGDNLIGFAHIVVGRLPHYNALAATTESLFVASAYRRTGAGLALKRAIEENAIKCGAAGVFVSAPIGSALDAILGHADDYTATSRVHFKALA